MKPETMMADGDECYVNHTSALECWLIMHSMRRVLNGGEDFPKRKGRLVHVASDPLQPKEIFRKSRNVQPSISRPIATRG